MGGRLNQPGTILYENFKVRLKTRRDIAGDALRLAAIAAIRAGTSIDPRNVCISVHICLNRHHNLCVIPRAAVC